MKWCLFLLFITSAQAKDPALNSVLDDSVQANLRNVKNQEIEAFLLESQQMKECEANTKDRDELHVCIMEKIDKLDKAAVENLSKNLNLEGYGVVKEKSPEAIKKYFDERLANALFGKKNNQNANQVNSLSGETFVDHKVFVDLYESQISKNFLTDLSNFCLNEVNFDKGEANRCIPKDYDLTKIPNYHNAKLTGKEDDVKDDPKYKDYKSKTSTAIDLRSCYKIPNKDEKNKEFKNFLNEKGSPEEMAYHWKFCIVSIKPLCDLYKYNPSAPTSATPSTNVKTDQTSVIVAADSSDQISRRACVALDRMKKYRKVIAELQNTQSEFTQSKTGKGFIELVNLLYQGKDENSIDNLTTMTSTDIGNALKDSDGFKEDKKRIEDCKNNDQKACGEFFKEKDQKHQDRVITEFEARTSLELKRISLLNNKDELKKYLESNGHAKLLSDIDKKTEDELNLIKAKIAEELKQERLAILNELKQKIQTQYEIVNTENDADKASKLNTIENDIRFKDERAKKLYHYNNVVTSYLELNTTGQVKSNKAILKKELESMNKAELKENETYFSQLEKDVNSGESVGDENNKISVDLKFVDELLDQK
jgi:hypothetical protein